MGVDFLNVLTLGQGALVGSEASLGELVNALVGGRTTSLDHVEDAALVWGQANNLAGNRTAQFGFCGCDL